jgi:signal transduction histidine kinase
VLSDLPRYKLAYMSASEQAGSRLHELLAVARELTGARHAWIETRDDLHATRGDVAADPVRVLQTPIVIGGETRGCLHLSDKRGGEFDDADRKTAAVLAAWSAMALELERTVATAESVEREWLRRSLAAAEEERRRWARELHDDTLQALGALRAMLSSARRSADVASLHTTLDGAVQQLADEIANLRSLITELRPAALDELGLAPALDALFHRVRTASRLEVNTAIELEHELTPDGDGRPRLDPDVETAIYRIVQESITNVAKHARANRVDVVVAERHDEIEIVVRDDGCGFDVSAPTSGFGLTGIRERVSLAGGELEIVSSGHGTAVLASLPAAPNERSDV